MSKRKSQPTTGPPLAEKFNFGESFVELEKITDWFERGDVELEEGLKKFERGLELAQKLKKRLQEVENKVEEIKKKFEDESR